LIKMKYISINYHSYLWIIKTTENQQSKSLVMYTGSDPVQTTHTFFRRRSVFLENKQAPITLIQVSNNIIVILKMLKMMQGWRDQITFVNSTLFQSRYVSTEFNIIILYVSQHVVQWIQQVRYIFAAV